MNESFVADTTREVETKGKGLLSESPFENKMIPGKGSHYMVIKVAALTLLRLGFF